LALASPPAATKARSTWATGPWDLAESDLHGQGWSWVVLVQVQLRTAHNESDRSHQTSLSGQSPPSMSTRHHAMGRQMRDAAAKRANPSTMLCQHKCMLLADLGGSRQRFSTCAHHVRITQESRYKRYRPSAGFASLQRT
jgi:hypothetical protein